MYCLLYVESAPVRDLLCFQNEEALKASLADYQHKLKKAEEKFEKLYSHAEHKLEL